MKMTDINNNSGHVLNYRYNLNIFCRLSNTLYSLCCYRAAGGNSGCCCCVSKLLVTILCVFICIQMCISSLSMRGLVIQEGSQYNQSKEYSKVNIQKEKGYVCIDRVTFKYMGMSIKKYHSYVCECVCYGVSINHVLQSQFSFTCMD